MSKAGCSSKQGSSQPTAEDGEKLRIVSSSKDDGSCEFVIVRDSWIKLGGNNNQTYFWPPKEEWEEYTDEEFLDLYNQELPGQTWEEHEIIVVHGTAFSYLDAFNLQKSCEAKKRKGAKLEDIYATTDDEERAKSSRAKRKKKSLGDDFVSKIVAKKRALETPDSQTLPTSKIIQNNNDQLRGDLGKSKKKVPVEDDDEDKDQEHEDEDQEVDEGKDQFDNEEEEVYSNPPSNNGSSPSTSSRSNLVPYVPSTPTAGTPWIRPARAPLNVNRLMKQAEQDPDLNRGLPLLDMTFKYYFLALLAQNSKKNSSGSGGPDTPDMSEVGPCPFDLDEKWPMVDPQDYCNLEELLGNDEIVEELIDWFKKRKNTDYYNAEPRTMARRILKGLFSLDLQASFVFSKKTKEKNKNRFVIFQGTRIHKLVLGKSSAYMLAYMTDLH